MDGAMDRACSEKTYRVLPLGAGDLGTTSSLVAGGRSRIILGDCIDVSSRLPAACQAFIYIDPPFGTGRSQPFRFGLGKRERPFRDHADPDAWWLHWEPRLVALIRVLRPGGILVVHLDPRLAPRVRLALDDRLGRRSFLNEIVWHYRSGGIARDRFPGKHDTLLVYRRGEGHLFHPQIEKRYLAHRLMRNGVEEFRDDRGWYRYATVDDVWQIPFLPADSMERLGYPTQKPEALVERLLLAFTDAGDAVADFTCGSGTLPAVAQRLGRMWIAVDQDPRAIACTAGRIARILSPSLNQLWRRAGIKGRRQDLGERLARLRERPATWGLAEEEIRLLSDEDVTGGAFQIEWPDGGAG